MPSFLSKVFGRKKDGKGSTTSRGRGSVGSLLDGKFEVVSPTVSPTAAEFPENAQRRNGRAGDATFGLFKVKSRQSRPSSPEPKKKEDPPPQLPLALPVPKGDAQARALGVVFEADPDAQVLSEDVIGSRRLTPLEVLILVRTCSQAIVARGLQTLGLMHPHWYSGSPDTQRRLISLFIHSLNPKNAITTLSPSSSSPTSIFNSEINYTRSPHDVAAVLRWGLRHLELDGRNFGRDESWYKTFADAERSSEYPPSAYSEKLAPLVPPAHLELINTTLDLFSSLAAHAEENGTSGSKLTKAFGLWLLATQRVGENDDWPKFYARWQDNGRILEHLFLARIRDESLRLRMPTRLSELVAQYPFVRGSTTDGDAFLRPQLSTRHFDALFVRVETEFSSPQEKVRRHPLQFLKDALAADVAVGVNECFVVWEKIRKTGNDENSVSSEAYPGLSDVFADETIRYLTLIPGNHPFKKVTSPTFSISETLQDTPTSRRWASSPGSAAEDVKLHTGITNGHIKPASEPSPLPSTSSPADWVQFSSTGFSDVSPSIAPLASTLFGQDVEKTNPPFQKPSKQSRNSSSSRTPSATRKSVEVARPRHSNVSRSEDLKLVSKSMPVAVVQVDEAFIEFWIDALLDPISSTWPKFVLCKLKPPFSDLTIDDKRIQYVVIEETFAPKPSPPAPAPAPPPIELTAPLEAVSSPEKSVTSSSPRSSTKTEKRFFGFFSSSGRNSGYGFDKLSTKGKKRVPPQAQASELGEMVKEDEIKPSATVRLRVPSPKSRKSTDISRKSVDVSRQSMDVPKSPGVIDRVSVKAEESPDREPAALVASTLAGDAVVTAVASSAVQDKAAVSLPAGEAFKSTTNVDFQVTEDATQPAAEAQALLPEGNNLVEQDRTTTIMTPAAEPVEQQPMTSSAPAIEAAVSNGHTLAAFVEKAEETTSLPTPEHLPSIEPSIGTRGLEAADPNPEFETLIPGQTVDVLEQKEAPSLPVEIAALAGTNEQSTTAPSVDEIKPQVAPELPAVIDNSEPDRHLSSDTTPEEHLFEENIVKAESVSEKSAIGEEHATVQTPSAEEEPALEAQDVSVPKEAVSDACDTLAHKHHAITETEPVLIDVSPAGVEEPMAPATVEDSADGEATIREESVLQTVEEPAETSVLTEETYKTETVPVVEEHIPQSAPEETDLSGYALADEQPADPITIQETVDTTESKVDSVKDVASASQDAPEPQLTDSVPVTESLVEPIPEPTSEDNEPAPQVMASTETASDIISHEDTSIVHEPASEVETEAGTIPTGADETPAPITRDSEFQLPDTPSEQPAHVSGVTIERLSPVPSGEDNSQDTASANGNQHHVGSEKEPLVEAELVPSPQIDAEHDVEPSQALTQPVTPAEPITEVLEIVREE